MFSTQVILNESDARRARSMIGRIDEALSSQAAFEPIRSGLPINVIQNHRKAIAAQKAALARSLEEYAQAKSGEFAMLATKWRHDPGVILIIARLARGLSQAELARKIGLKEQQIQRYEADRYRAISLSNYKRIASLLGVSLAASLNAASEAWLGLMQPPEKTFTRAELDRVIQHAKEREWFFVPSSVEEGYAALFEYVAETSTAYGSPTLLRTGMNSEDLKEDAALIAWRARITKLAEAELESTPKSDELLNIGWLRDLTKLSQRDDGPFQAKRFLREKGIILVTEGQVPGLKLDGAALLVRGIPIVALTLRYDRLDNFWFTLLHEVAHIILHHQIGLSAGFFDDLDQEQVDEIETEANDFAESILIPPDRWKLSPARISLAQEPIADLARQLDIHPAIVFGRIRKARNNYKLFSDRIGTGQVRKWFQ